MLRRSLFNRDRLVIVESPNKCQKIQQLLAHANDWSFDMKSQSNNISPLNQLLNGTKHEKETVFVKPTIGHFMETRELVIERSQHSLASIKRETTGQIAETGIDSVRLFMRKKMREAENSFLNYLPELSHQASLLAVTPITCIRSDNNSLEEIVKCVKHNPKIKEIVLASDPDREGELIAVHVYRYLCQKLGLRSLNNTMADTTSIDNFKRKPHTLPFSRAYIQSLTADGVLSALRTRRFFYCDYALAEAASARHSMDRLFGFIGSNAIRLVEPRFRSVGRVQTPTLILVRELEEKIDRITRGHKTIYGIQGSLIVACHSRDSVSQGTLDDTTQKNSKSNKQNHDISMPKEPTFILKRQLTFNVQKLIDFSSSSNTKANKKKPDSNPIAEETNGLFNSKEAAEEWLKKFSSFERAPLFGDINTKKSMESKLIILLLSKPLVSTSLSHPPPPHTMATLLSAANAQIKVGTEALTAILQDLFQSGLITYPRTDSTRVDDTFIQVHLEPYIARKYGKDQFFNWQKNSKKKKVRKAKDINIEDAHEALRPTRLDMHPDSASVLAMFGLTDPHAPTYFSATRTSSINPAHKHQVYRIIYNATIAAFMVSAETETITALLGVLPSSQRPRDGTKEDTSILTARLSASRWIKLGWRSAGGGGRKEGEEDEEEVPINFALVQKLVTTIQTIDAFLSGGPKPDGGDLVATVSNLITFEKPLVAPKPYTEGTLITALKAFGVGRPSTYATIMKTLKERKYLVEDSSGRLHTTEDGRGVVMAARNMFPSLVDIRFTASFERELDCISKHRVIIENAHEKNSLVLGDPTNPDLGEGNNPLTCYTLSRLLYALQDMIGRGMRYHSLLSFYMKEKRFFHHTPTTSGTMKPQSENLREVVPGINERRKILLQSLPRFCSLQDTVTSTKGNNDKFYHQILLQACKRAQSGDVPTENQPSPKSQGFYTLTAYCADLNRYLRTANTLCFSTSLCKSQGGRGPLGCLALDINSVVPSGPERDWLLIDDVPLGENKPSVAPVQLKPPFLLTEDKKAGQHSIKKNSEKLALLDEPEHKAMPIKKARSERIGSTASKTMPECIQTKNSIPVVTRRPSNSYFNISGFQLPGL